MRMNALWNLTRAAALLGVPLLLLYLACVPFLYAYAQESVEATDASESVRDTEQEAASAVGNDGGPRYSITPVVANEKAKPRDIIKKELLVTNHTDQRVDLYITVHNIDPVTGDMLFVGPGEADLSSSLANWIEITRGVITLAAGESRKIPYLIHVSLTAKPASYFARIGFHAGQTRARAEAKEAELELILNLEVLDDANERLQLGNFMSDDSVVLGNSVGFSYTLENVGNRLIEPRGSIRIFNRKGEEVGSVPLNAEGEEITPANKRQLAAAWSSNGRFGKYKAFLDLEYGEDQLASVQDTVYFWVFPWKEIFASLTGVVVLAFIGTYIVHMRAMAQPVPARRNYVTAPEPVSSFGRAYEAAPQYAAPLPVPSRQAASGEPTVVLSRRDRARACATMSPTVVPSVQARVSAPTRAGRAPTRSASGPQVRGNTVELASRR